MSNTLTIDINSKSCGSFLGAAIGDSLGWPYELRAGTVQVSYTGKDAFPDWSRRTGGRFYNHEEVIGAGDYSDDTQLILATARSLQYGKKWLDAFSLVELPFWTKYERGGGGATKRAAKLWLEGRQPWQAADKQRHQYFQAGGNGVAMRILPHCIDRAVDAEFRLLANDIFLNGITTHGHPLALIGALAYGYAVWHGVKVFKTLEYGELVDTLLSSVSDWGAIPSDNDLYGEWFDAANQALKNYQELWNKSLDSFVRNLEFIKSEIQKGALLVEGDVLGKIGFYDKRINGAGTVAAMSAVFIVSSNAINPEQGLLKVAKADGADSDTIASMAGGLYGALFGEDWAARYIEYVQDREYIRRISKQIVNNPGTTDKTPPPITESMLTSFYNKLPALIVDKKVILPDGRRATLLECVEIAPETAKYSVVRYKFITDDSQQLYIKKFSRKPQKERTLLDYATTAHGKSEIARPQSVSNRIGVKIGTSLFEETIDFYSNRAGLEVKKKTNDYARFKNGLSVYKNAKNKNGEQTPSLVLCFMVEDIKAVFKNIEQSDLKIVTSLTTAEAESFFKCLDPNGYVVEFNQI